MGGTNIDIAGANFVRPFDESAVGISRADVGIGPYGEVIGADRDCGGAFILLGTN